MNALTSGDRLAIAPALKSYKLPSGGTDYVEVLKIPMDDRLLGLSEKLGFEMVYKNIVGAITVAMENLNISKPLSADQILELADEIMDTAGQDALSLEDILLFLQKLVRGETAETYSRMDIPTFMRMLEKHRESRYKALKNYEYEQHAQLKGLAPGVQGKQRLNIDEDAGTVLSLMQTMYLGKNDSE